MTALKAGELKQWKKDSGYHQRSIAETAMYRFKQLIGPTLSLRNYNARVGEITAGVKVMNKLIGAWYACSPASELSGINGLGERPSSDGFGQQRR
uniref:Transposase n=1 Tax=Klebsiella pneumoniae TaxID=573 RepID=A0A8B0SUH7_KLEPN|nr:Transposase [Klebsiella pneumoniae]